MKYRTAAAFRQALEARLQERARRSGGSLSLVRLRKTLVFDRLLARLLQVAPDRWLLKGGVALDIRLGTSARATKDMDLFFRANVEAATETLLAAQAFDLVDYFAFSIRRTDQLTGLEGIAVRYHVRALLAGRLFEVITIDIGFSDALGWQPDLLPGSDLLEFAEIPTIQVPIVPVAQHIAEKVHAYTRSYGGMAAHPSSRVKDLIDLVLIQGHVTVIANQLRLALVGTFQGRATHDLPSALPLPPSDWTVGYQLLAQEVGLDPAIAVGYARAAAFLDPILAGDVRDEAFWVPNEARWENNS